MDGKKKSEGGKNHDVRKLIKKKKKTRATRTLGGGESFDFCRRWR